MVSTGTAVIYQSQRHDAYRAALDLLQRRGLSYYCTCTRSRIQQIGGLYDGHCRDLQLGPQGAAIRLRQTAPVYGFHDRLQGELHADPALAGKTLSFAAATGCSPTTRRW